MKWKAILCFFLRYHKYSYYTNECIRCGKGRKISEDPQAQILK